VCSLLGADFGFVDDGCDAEMMVCDETRSSTHIRRQPTLHEFGDDQGFSRGSDKNNT
jgi:hypothetical protein